MAFDPLTVVPAAVTAAAQIGSNLLATQGSYKKNKALMKRQNEINLENWNMTNAYNAPEAQVARLQQAGLNPNLAYGSISSTSAASSLPAAHATPGNYRAPTEGVASSYFDTRVKQAQLSNLESQNNLIEEQVNNQRIENALKNLDLGIKTEIRPITVAQAQNLADKTIADLANTRANTTLIGFNTQIRDMEMQILRDTLPMVIQRVSVDLTNAQLKGTQSSQEITLNKQEIFKREWENQLRSAGVNPNDPLWARLAVKIFDKLFPDSPESGPGFTGLPVPLFSREVRPLPATYDKTGKDVSRDSLANREAYSAMFRFFGP